MFSYHPNSNDAYVPSVAEHSASARAKASPLKYTNKELRQKIDAMSGRKPEVMDEEDYVRMANDLKRENERIHQARADKGIIEDMEDLSRLYNYRVGGFIGALSTLINCLAFFLASFFHPLRSMSLFAKEISRIIALGFKSHKVGTTVGQDETIVTRGLSILLSLGTIVTGVISVITMFVTGSMNVLPMMVASLALGVLNSILSLCTLACSYAWGVWRDERQKLEALNEEYFDILAKHPNVLEMYKQDRLHIENKISQDEYLAYRHRKPLSRVKPNAETPSDEELFFTLLRIEEESQRLANNIRKNKRKVIRKFHDIGIAMVAKGAIFIVLVNPVIAYSVLFVWSVYALIHYCGWMEKAANSLFGDPFKVDKYVPFEKIDAEVAKRNPGLRQNPVVAPVPEPEVFVPPVMTPAATIAPAALHLQADAPLKRGRTRTQPPLLVDTAAPVSPKRRHSSDADKYVVKLGIFAVNENRKVPTPPKTSPRETITTHAPQRRSIQAF